MKIKVKNMVCDRCKKVLESELQQEGFQIRSIDLGEVHLKESTGKELGSIRKILSRNGFELVEEENEVLVSGIKNQLITALEENKLNQNLSEYLSERLNKEYSILSKLFSANQGITIEKYFIRLKIEKVKEMIQMKNKTFSEIAYVLNYASSGHLAKQFKSITGMSMSEYQKAREWNRKSLDRIV